MKKYILALIVFTVSNYGMSILSYRCRGEVIIGGEFLIPSILFTIWIVSQETKSKQDSYRKSRV